MRGMGWTRPQMEQHSEADLAYIDAVLDYEVKDKGNTNLKMQHETYRMSRGA